MLVYQRVSHVFLRKSSLLSQDPVLFSEDPNGGSQRGKEANRQILGDGRGVATPWRRRGDAATKGGSK